MPIRVLLGVLVIMSANPAAAARPDPAPPHPMRGVPQSPDARYRFDNGRDALDIPIELSANHVYVKLRVGNGREGSFILDTGGGASVIDPELARAAGLKLGQSVVARGAGEETRDAWLLTGVDYSLPGLTLTGQSLTAISLRALEVHTGRAMDGVLGYDFLRQFIVEIDYAGRRLHLHDPANWSYSGVGDTLALNLAGPIPAIRATLNGSIPMDFFIDTGASMAVKASRAAVERLDLEKVAVRTIDARPGYGVGGATEQSVGRFDSFSIGRFRFDKPVLLLSHDKSGAFGGDRSTRDGVIGGDVWRRFRVILDYPHARMFLEPNAGFPEPFEVDMTGLSLRFEPTDSTAWIVETVLPGSPADEAGLKPHDRITAVDGVPATREHLEAYRLATKKEGTTFTYTCAPDSAGEPRTLRLTTRPRI